MTPSSDPQGRVALMLCESVLHVLVEEGVLTKTKAIEAIETVVELTREIAEVWPPTSRTRLLLASSKRSRKALRQRINPCRAASSSRARRIPFSSGVEKPVGGHSVGTLEPSYGIHLGFCLALFS